MGLSGIEKLIIAGMVGVIALVLAFWGTIGYVAWHFITKFW